MHLSAPTALRLRRRPTAVALALALAVSATVPADAALSNPPHEDLSFVAEHLPETGQDARFLTLPWPGERLRAGTWTGAVAAGYNDSAADFLTLRGAMLSASATRAVTDRWGIEVLAFYDTMTIGGDGGRAVLRPFSLPVPLDLPEWAEISHPRGDFTHWGVGAAWVRELSPPASTRPWSLVVGALADRLELRNFAMDYRLVGGADAGTTGTVDHSSTATYVVPFAGVQQIRPLGERWTMAPRAIAGVPLPPGDFDLRVTGPGFDLSTARGDGDPGKVGDGFVGLGLAFQHLPSGLEIDLGSTAWYPVFEKLTHAAVGRAWQLQVVWRFGEKRS